MLGTTATYDEVPRTDAEQRVWFASVDRDRYPVLVATDASGQVIGWSALQPFSPRSGWRYTVENAVYVAAAAHGQGAGTALLRQLVEAAKELGFQSIIARLDSGSVASLRLHTRLGFRQVGVLSHVGWKFGTWLDVIYLQLVLREATG